MAFQDPNQLHLPKSEAKVFRKFKSSDQAELTIQEFKKLRHYHLVKGAINGISDWFFDDLPAKGLVNISDFGKQYRERLREKHLENIKYVITTFITVAALLIPIIFNYM